MSVTYGEGCYQIYATAVPCGRDVTVAFTGGELPHVGAVSLGVYEPQRDSATVSTITCFGHRDDAFSRQAAKEIASALQCTACVSVGVHVDDASSEEIQLLTDNFRHCLDWLKEFLAQKE